MRNHAWQHYCLQYLHSTSLQWLKLDNNCNDALIRDFVNFPINRYYLPIVGWYRWLMYIWIADLIMKINNIFTTSLYHNATISSLDMLKWTLTTVSSVVWSPLIYWIKNKTANAYLLNGDTDFIHLPDVSATTITKTDKKTNRRCVIKNYHEISFMFA